MAQITSLIGAHSDVFAAILKENHPVVTMATLQELALVTAVIGRSGVGEWCCQIGSSVVWPHEVESCFHSWYRGIG